jgi:hypothetical protein
MQRVILTKHEALRIGLVAQGVPVGNYFSGQALELLQKRRSQVQPSPLRPPPEHCPRAPPAGDQIWER